jgi:hypothetical protein
MLLIDFSNVMLNMNTELNIVNWYSRNLNRNMKILGQRVHKFMFSIPYIYMTVHAISTAGELTSVKNKAWTNNILLQYLPGKQTKISESLYSENPFDLMSVFAT